MLDTRTAALLAHLNGLCREGKYEVVEADELLSCFPPKAGMDRENLQKTLAYLSENGYVDIRYEEDGLYCLCPLPAGRLYTEHARAAKRDAFRRRRDTVLLAAAGAFVGGFLGALLAWGVALWL